MSTGITAAQANEIGLKAQQQFADKNFQEIVEKIDERIKLEAGGSKQYKTGGVYIELSGDYDNINGFMYSLVEAHYVGKGFKVSLTDRVMGSDSLVIRW